MSCMIRGLPNVLGKGLYQSPVFYATMFWGRGDRGSNFLEFGRRELVSSKRGLWLKL